MRRDAGHKLLRRHVLSGLVALLLAHAYVPGVLTARDLLPPKEQQDTEFDATRGPSFDKQKRGVPQSIFVSIEMARGYEVEWDSFGRQGWYTQDPRIKPVGAGTTVFTPETPAVYVVFEVAPLEDPAQFGAQWFLEDDQGRTSDTPVGRDVLEVPGHSRYGFLELKSPPQGWKKGNYLVKLFITPLGQQPFHAVNQVGTMGFKIEDKPAVTGAATP
ncbi:MAG TPA: hypothetical protein VHQ67_06505 [Nitrospiraceae bacterium]|jgi:hypothetical protein|nr:hypothetical protein [Nitrospiraceae bacterium]